MRHLLLATALLAVTTAAGAQDTAMNTLAERYVRLALSLGQHDADYVDAYYGPEPWRTEALAEKLSLADIQSRADALVRELQMARPPESADEMVRLRHTYLTTQLRSLRARASMVGGARMTFDEESRALYDAVAPMHTEAELQALLASLEAVLPGQGSLIDRLEAFRTRFVIPRDRLDATFQAAITGCRERTQQYVQLPGNESFTVEYVTGKSWSGYNWYQGNYRSLIQVNTDLPIYVDRAIDLACHEGYPGHHAYNVLIEKNLVRDRGWWEYSVVPLFSPQALIMEGTANYGIEVAFPKADRLEFERRVIFPAARLNPADVTPYYEVMDLVARLSYAGNEAARRYLNGEINASQAADWLAKYGLYSRPRAEQRVKFIDQYRSYVINYNLGKDMVAAHVETLAGADWTPARRWQQFLRLISSPRLPSGLTTPNSTTPNSQRVP